MGSMCPTDGQTDGQGLCAMDGWARHPGNWSLEGGWCLPQVLGVSPDAHTGPLLRRGECGRGVPWCFPTDSGFWLVLVLCPLITSCPVNTDTVGL